MENYHNLNDKKHFEVKTMVQVKYREKELTWIC